MLGLSWECFLENKVLFFGNVLGLSWEYAGNMLGICWECFRNIVGMRENFNWIFPSGECFLAVFYENFLKVLGLLGE